MLLQYELFNVKVTKLQGRQKHEWKSPEGCTEEIKWCLQNAIYTEVRPPYTMINDSLNDSGKCEDKT